MPVCKCFQPFFDASHIFLLVSKLPDKKICVIRAIRVTYKYKLDSELARLSTYGAQETIN